MAAWGNNFFKKIFFLLFFHFSAPLKCHWPIRASSLKSHSPAGRIYSPLATGRVLMKRLTNRFGDGLASSFQRIQEYFPLM